MKRVAYYVNDLLFTSKIREVASQLGLEAVKLNSPDALETIASIGTLILDLRRPEAMLLLDKVHAAKLPIACLGFVDHELVDVMQAARERGCTALAKGKFSTELPNLLRSAAEN